MTFLPPMPDYHRGENAIKWNLYPPDVLPLWVADTDFLSPRVVQDAIQRRAEHNLFGYQRDTGQLLDVIAVRMRERHGIPAEPGHILLTSNLVSALGVCAHIAGKPGTGILVTTPIYPPFFSSIKLHDQLLVNAPMVSSVENGVLRYEMDFDAIEAAVTPETRMWMFCNPHNPVGRSFTRAELERVAEIVLKHDLIIVSDEIHADLRYAGQSHISVASLSPEVAAHTITLNSPSKTFNIPGLGLGFAVITDESLRKRFQETAWNTGLGANNFSIVGATAAYIGGQPYLDEILPYLQENRDLISDYLSEHLPEIAYTMPEATYLMWLDCRALNLPESPFSFFLHKARVALNDGAHFGDGAEGFVRLNYGCTRETLLAALDRMRDAIRAERSAAS